MWPGIFKQIFSRKIHRFPRKRFKGNYLFSGLNTNYQFSESCVYMSQKNINTEEKHSLCQVVNDRLEEARRSILVQVQSSYSYKELYAYCNTIGEIKYMLHYQCGVEPLNFILIEFDSEDDVKNVLSSSCHLDESHAIPVQSPFLWFRNTPNKKSLKLPKVNKLNVVNGNKVPSEESIIDFLRKSDSISDQMNVLYEKTKLTDLGTRLRFLTARQVELALTGMFTNAIAYPFGSSINGYGKNGCDLDLILKLDSLQNVKDSRLVYQCKEGFGNERSQSQRHMEAIGDLLQLFLPGCSQVRRILQARVPILKYNQQFTDVECDLSMTNMTAFNMSELLYLYGSLDPRVNPLVFTIRKWAKEVGLTNNSPGRWISNFSLTLLVLSFLQRSYKKNPPVLPPINTLAKLVDKSPKTQNDLESHCAFNIPSEKLPKNKNKSSLQELLQQFFSHYSKYDFASNAISLNEATDVIKPEHSALYIVNPLERGLNVSKNVSPEELEKLRIEMRNANWILESNEKNTTKWGIMSLFYNEKHSSKQNSSRAGRLVEVSKIFDNEQEEILYKNEIVEKQIDEIKNDTDKQLKEMDMDSKMKSRKPARRRQH